MRAAQAEKTRKAVLATARLLFAEHGFDGTSLQLIADTMGVTKANVYYYFRTKLEILEALLDMSIALFDAMLSEAQAIRGRRARTEFLVDGFVEQVIVNRSIAPLSRTDPGMQRHERIQQALDKQSERAIQLLYGDQPTIDERAAYAMASDVGPVMRQLGHLTDAEVRTTLRKLCLRVLRA
jgi:AcrR family transcriptional regulator